MKFGKQSRVLLLSNAPSQQTPALERISEMAVAEEVAAVESALRNLGYPIFSAAIRQCDELQDALATYSPDLVFNLCEGLDGNSIFESHVAAMLELQKVAFTGNHSLTLALARNKSLAKKVMRSSGIRTPEWLCCREIPKALPETLHFPLICKPACEDASLGILADAVVQDFPALIRKLEKLLPDYSREGVLIEEFIAGREFNVAILPEANGARPLPPSEIDFSALSSDQHKIVSYSAKWIKDDLLYHNTPSHCPSDLPCSLRLGLQQSALAVHQALEANSYGRVDIRVDEQGRIFVLEYNPNPDISPDSGFCKALEADKISYHDFVRKVMQEAITRAQRKQRQ
jgi:D-alanine-D-alanine ligase